MKHVEEVNVQKEQRLMGSYLDLQVEALKTAKRRNPNGRWWIKADARDMRAGVMESMRHEWSGDVDLGDGQLNTNGIWHYWIL